ncbi:hypothetical protein evm_010965 [Chilo suppressalis]|nr:hypothetical protein evm_010965 [Chilo suppressalis]
MGIKSMDIAFLLLNLIYCAYSEHILSCNVTTLNPCPGANQVCNQLTHQCVCKDGFTLVDDNCESPSADTSSRHTVTGIVVSIFTIALLVCGIVLVFRKYDLANYIRQKINMRRNNSTTYEDVMIGQDDPPLSP